MTTGTTGTTGTPEPGEMLGHFELGRRLGVGGMGIVYQAVDTHLDRRVALKVISPRIAQDDDFRARFTREARAQASLDSPHVVQVYSFGEADGQLYIASQLVPDGDLGRMLHKHGAPPPRIALHLISQIADGLSDAHAAGLVHRDIKPANVLLRNRDNTLHAYLADFGIARQAVSDQHLTKVGGVVGTPSYMAPELHTGGEAGSASDVYSLGCLVWANLSGAPPYQGDSDFWVIKGHVEGPIPQLEPTGPLAGEINRVLRTAMAKRPGERYPSAGEMRDDLNRVVRRPDDPAPIRVAGPARPDATVARQSWPPPSPRTPTPTPTPSHGGSAPPAGPVAGAAPAYRGPPGAPPRSGPPSGARPANGPDVRWWLLGGLLAVLLIAAVTVVALVVAQDDGNETAGGSGGNGSGYSQPDEEKAVTELTEAFSPVAGEETGACIAEQVVEDAGVAKLVETGVLTEDLEYDPQNQTSDQALNGELSGVVVDATIGCLGTGQSS